MSTTSTKSRAKKAPRTKGVPAKLTSATSAAFNITPGPQPHGVALLAKTAYVDFDGTSTGSEASNLMFTLQSFGLTVDPFVDISDLNIIAVTRNTRILAIPELENGDVTPDLSTTARQRIASYVRNGGTLMAFTTNTSTVRATSVVNTLFGFTVAATSGVGPYTLDATGAAGTAFEGGPASIPELDATIPVTEASLPPGSKVIYRSGANAAVAVIPVGSGRIIIIGWDWFNAPPKGTAVEGGWVDVLRRGTL